MQPFSPLRGIAMFVPLRVKLCISGLLATGAVMFLVSAAVAQSPPSGTRNASTTARPASGPMQGLLRATEAQLHIAFRNDIQEHERRREQVAAAVAAWRAAGRSAANDRLLVDWLRAAIRKSMPGSREALPELPKFEQPVVATPAIAPTPATNPTSTMRQKPVVQNTAQAHEKLQSSQPAGQHTLNGSTSSADRPTASDSTQKSATERQSTTAPEAAPDFWTSHPANGELPAELSGDPFQDDPGGK
jgi:hypothetical protein